MEFFSPYSTAWLLGLASALLATGLVAGVLAGLLGVGGGIVIVPVLHHLFTLLGVDESVRMHAAVGTSLATIIPASIALLVALSMAFKRDGFAVADGLPGTALPGSGIGGVSTLMGIGGSTLSVPILNALRVPMHTAVGSGAMLGMVISVPGALATTGWGAKLGHSINARRLRQVFALFLALTAARMFYGLLN